MGGASPPQSLLSISHPLHLPPLPYSFNYPWPGPPRRFSHSQLYTLVERPNGERGTLVPVGPSLPKPHLHRRLCTPRAVKHHLHEGYFFSLRDFNFSPLPLLLSSHFFVRWMRSICFSSGVGFTLQGEWWNMLENGCILIYVYFR